MAKDKGSEKDNTCSVKKEGDKFICTECGSKITAKEDYCPGCKRHVNWDKVNIELHRTFP